MKLYLDKNIAKGTPEELAKYKELISNHQLDRLKEVSETLREKLGYKTLSTQGEVELVEEIPHYKSKAFYLLKDHIVLKHIEENLFESSKGDVWTIREGWDFITLANKESDDFENDEIIMQERFDFAKQLGITLYKDTDFALEAEGKLFRVTGYNEYFSRGHLVNISRDDGYDRLPIVEGVISNKRNIIFFHNLELVEGQKSEENFESFISSTDEEKSPSIEDHKYYEVIDTNGFADTIEKGTVVKVGDYNHLFNCITSDGIRQIAHLDDLKPLEVFDIEDRFKFAEMTGVRLTTATNFKEECKGHHFRVTKDEFLSNFEDDEVLTVFSDDGSGEISFKCEEGFVQFVNLKHVQEIARPKKGLYEGIEQIDLHL